MAAWENLKAAIQAVIKANNNQEITGDIMQAALLSMINSLGANYQFAGILTPSTSFIAPDGNVFLLGSAGTYTNFGPTTVKVPNGSIGLFMYNGTYSSHVIQSSGVLDVSMLNAIDGVPTQYSTLQNALNAIPSNLRYNGMEIIYIDSTTEQYVKYRMIAKEWSVLSTAWQGADEKPTAGSNNLAKSGGVYESLISIKKDIGRVTIGLLVGYGVNGATGELYESPAKATTDYIYDDMLLLTTSNAPVNSVFKYYNDGTFSEDTSLRGKCFIDYHKGSEKYIRVVLNTTETTYSNIIEKYESGLYGEDKNLERKNSNEIGLTIGKAINGTNGGTSDFPTRATTDIIKENSVIELVTPNATIASIYKFFSDGTIQEDTSLRGQTKCSYQKGAELYARMTINLASGSLSSDEIIKHYGNGCFLDISTQTNRIDNILGEEKVGLSIGYGVNGVTGELYEWATKATTALITDDCNIISKSIYAKINAVFFYNADNTVVEDKTNKGKTTTKIEIGNYKAYRIVFDLINSPATYEQIIYKYCCGKNIVIQNAPIIDCWGDSLTQSLDNNGVYTSEIYPRTLTDILGIPCNCYGDGGELSYEIAARQGGCPMYLNADVEIPAEAEVQVTLQLKSTFNNADINANNTFLAQNNTGIIPCKIGNVVGSIANRNNNIVFWRNEAGASETVKRGELVYPRWMDNTLEHIQVIWIGQNRGGLTDNELVELVKNMIRYSNNQKFITMPAIQMTNVEDVIALENLYKKEFGLKCFCVREYLNHYGIEKAIANGFITEATSQDLIDIENGIIPTSLRRDVVHLNFYGYYIIAQRLAELINYNNFVCQ